MEGTSAAQQIPLAGLVFFALHPSRIFTSTSFTKGGGCALTWVDLRLLLGVSVAPRATVDLRFMLILWQTCRCCCYCVVASIHFSLSAACCVRLARLD